jgi:hypothetical protein
MGRIGPRLHARGVCRERRWICSSRVPHLLAYGAAAVFNRRLRQRLGQSENYLLADGLTKDARVWVTEAKVPVAQVERRRCGAGCRNVFSYVEPVHSSDLCRCGDALAFEWRWLLLNDVRALRLE